MSTQRLMLGTEKALSVLVLLILTGGILPLLLTDPSTATNFTATSKQEETPFGITVMWMAIYGLASLGILVRWKRFVYLMMKEKFLVALVGVVILSILWSAAPEVTLRSSVALVGTTSVGAYLAVRFSLSEQLHLLAWALGIAAVLSIVVVLTMPARGLFVDTSGQAWRGIYEHRNILGRHMALGAVACMLIVASRRFRWIPLIGLGLSIGLILLSNSKTALLVFALFPFLLPLYGALRWRLSLTIPFLAVAAVLGGGALLWVVPRVAAILALLGKEVTLSGRTQIWSLAFDMITQRPWLGYGYSGFWRGWEGDSASLYILLGYEVPHAHNGILDLWLDLGLLGVLLFALGFILACLRAVDLARLSEPAVRLWPLTFLAFLFLYNLAESTILKQGNIFWVLYVSTTLSTLIVSEQSRSPVRQLEHKQKRMPADPPTRASSTRPIKTQL